MGDWRRTESSRGRIMTALNRYRVDASPLAVVAADAWLDESTDQRARDEHRVRATIDQVKRSGTRSPTKLPRYGVTGRVWTIVAVVIIAWAIIAIPAFLLFG